jgi:hypothetical protein
MGVFNIIETFFFLSLAITFVLILLLVNHFKQRINTLENKCDTMFEITNNILQELGGMKRAMFMMSSVPVSKTTPEVVTDVRENEDKIYVSDDEEEEEEDEDDEDDEEEDEEDEEDDEEEDEEIRIKIVNIDVQDKIAVEDITDELIEEDTEGDLEEIPENGSDAFADPAIKVDKVEEDDVKDIDPMEITDDHRDVYNKMTVQELKKLVITKGLCSDTSKLKKNELLKLLEEP